MSKQVERLRYFDREYLRSYDFTDEQSYHIEMRRRLNHRLHLHGIVYGLQLVQDQDSVPPDAIFFSIAPGMAIDQTGREIFLPAPYSLSAENILNRPDLTAGDNEVWLCYRENATGLPAAGYRDCNSPDQQTRYQETYQIALKPLGRSSATVDCGGIRLGVITLSNSNGWQVTNVENKGRTYVGIRAQRLIAADEEPDNVFKMAAKNIQPLNRIPLPGYVDVSPGVVTRSNLIVEKNVVIGDDFELNASAYQSLPTTFSNGGNLKITQDMFLAGDFYGFVNGNWYKLKQYIQSLMLNVKVGTPQAISVSPQATNLTTGTENVTVQSDVVATNTQVLLSIMKIDWQSPARLTNWSGNSNDFIVEVTTTGLQPTGVPKSYNLPITWNVGPAVFDSGGSNWILPVKNLVVNYIAIFQP